MTIILKKSASKFLKHERCPRCAEQGRDREGNNLGVWDDGHKWCFSCGYFEQAEAVKQKEVLLRKIADAANSPKIDEIPGTKRRPAALPPDLSSSIPAAPSNWLKKYQITPNEVARHRMSWSPSWERLIWPYFTPEGKLMFWQGRYFGHPEPGRPKYYNSGDPSAIMDIHGVEFMESCGRTLVLVEDKLSAIKVGRMTTVMPLYGSNLPDEQLRALAMMFDVVVLWLDHDMAYKMMGICNRMGNFFKEASMILTRGDPKVYGNAQIRTELVKKGIL